jgi:hypothetical protein
VTREQDLVYDICDVLENVGDRLKREPRKTVVLRLAQERIRDLTRDTRHRDLILLDYFLRSFVERLWFNLMIDFPYELGEETSKIRREILDGLVQDVGSTLEELADSLCRKDSAGCYKAYGALANAYAQKTRELEAARR